MRSKLRIPQSKEEKEYWKPKLKHTFHLLETLETQFPDWILPADVWMTNLEGSKIDHFVDLNKRIDSLCESKLVESKKYIAHGTDGTDKKVEMPAFKYRITPLGLDFLNNLRARKTNKLILFLTISLFVIGFIQIVLMVIQLLK